MYVIILFPFDGGIPGMDFAPENPDQDIYLYDIDKKGKI